MDTNQEQRRQRRGSTSSSGPAAGQADVFDTHGNDLLRAHVEEAKAGQDEQETSVLDAAASEEEVAQQVRQEETRGLEILEHEEQQRLLDEVKNTQLATGASALGGVAEKAVLDAVQARLDRAEVVVAREEGHLDDLMQDALRESAIDSRDEVIVALQRLMTSPADLDLIGALDGPGDKAIQLIEYLAVEIMDPELLFALAAYDHADITSRIVLSSEAMNMSRYLTPLAQMMGGFAPILYQLVTDQLELHPPPDTSRMEEREAEKTRRNATRPIAFNILNFLRLVRSTAV